MARLFTAEEIKAHLKTEAEIKERIILVVPWCTEVGNQEIQEIDNGLFRWFEENGNIHLVAQKEYTFPTEYLSMSVGAVQLAEAKRTRGEEEKKMKEQEEEEAERREYARLKKKYG